MESDTKNTTIWLNWQLAFICSFVLFLFILHDSYASKHKIIALTEIVEHLSLAQAKQGILDVVLENVYQIAKNLHVIDKNVQGSISNSILIAKKFIASKSDAIVSILTQSAQSVLSVIKSTGISLVFFSVTDPVSTGLVQDLSVPVDNTCAMDFPLISEEISLIKTLIPNIKTIGFLHNSSESNSIKIINLMKQAILGKIEFIETTVTNSNQVGQVITGLIERVEAIYIPSDNTIFSGMPKLIQMSQAYKLSVFLGNPDSVRYTLFVLVTLNMLLGVRQAIC